VKPAKKRAAKSAETTDATAKSAEVAKEEVAILEVSPAPPAVSEPTPSEVKVAETPLAPLASLAVPSVAETPQAPSPPSSTEPVSVPPGPKKKSAAKKAVAKEAVSATEHTEVTEPKPESAPVEAAPPSPAASPEPVSVPSVISVAEVPPPPSEELQAARAQLAEVLQAVAERPKPLDPQVDQALMAAAIAGIQGARPRNLEMALEALLFSTNQPLTVGEIGKALEATPEEVTATLAALEKTLAERPSSIALWSRSKNGENGYILDVKAAFRKEVATLAPPALRVALVETLALIALNQPVSQRRLVAERGSTVYEHVKELTELGYVLKQRKGINFYLRTTPTFAGEFGLPDDPEAIRHALAKAAGLAGASGAITSPRVWIDHQAPNDLKAEAETLAEQKRAEEEAARAAEAKRIEEENARAREAKRVADEEAARKAAEEAAFAEAKRQAEEALAKRQAEEERRLQEDAARAKAEEEARLLAIAAAAARAEECVVQGGDLEDVAEKKGKKKKPEVEGFLSDAFSTLGGSEVAW